MKQNKTIITILFFIILLGGFLRFYRIKELGTFRSDQAIESSHTLEILRGKPRLIGIKTSVSEVRNGAVMYYILAPLLWLFGYDPVAGGVLQSLLSLSTIPLIFLLGKKLKDNFTGILAAFFVSTSPLLVSYSRQTLLAFYPLFFSGLILFLFSKVLEKFNIKINLILGFLLGFMLQIHYLTITFFGLTLITAPFFLKRRKLYSFYTSLIIGFLIGLLPLIIFELRHEFFNTKMALSYFKQSESLAFSKQYLLNFWPLVLGKLLFAHNYWLGLLSLLLIISTALGKIIKRYKFVLLEKICWLQMLINFIILFVFSFRQQTFRAQKAINAFLPLILLISYSLNFLIKKASLYQKKLFFLTICLAILLVNFSSFRLTENHGAFMKEGWNLPGTQKAADLIISDLDGKTFNVTMYVDAENQGLPLRYFLEVAGKKPLGIEKYGEVEVLYLLKEPEVNLYKIATWELTSFGSFNIAKQWPIQNGFLLYRLEKQKT